MKLVNFRRLKSAVGHDHLNEETNLLKIIFYLKQDRNWQQLAERRY
jgi:hypothetical protein